MKIKKRLYSQWIPAILKMVYYVLELEGKDLGKRTKEFFERCADIDTG